MIIKSSSSTRKQIIYILGAGLASFVFVLLINLVGSWFGFKRNENVPIEEVGYFNTMFFLISIGALAVLSYGSVFYLITKVFKFNRK